MMITNRGANILIVDDNPDNLHFLTQLLSMRKYTARPVPSGPLALQAVAEEVPDLILLDIMMPEMDGYKVCRQLKANPDTADIPVVFISALTETADKTRGFAAGGIDYITKPFQFEEVISRLEIHLSLHNLKRALVEKNIQLETEIRARKTAEHLLLEYLQEIEARNDELDAFAGTIAHDLKGPLSYLVAISSVLSVDCCSSIDEESQKLLQSMTEHSLQMATIIDNLLLLTSIRQQQPLPVRLEMNEIVNQSLKRLSYLPQEVDITFPHHWPSVYGFAPWVEEVWVNFISNAIKYGGKEVKIELGYTPQPDRNVRFWITDNGPGVEQELIKHLFTQLPQINPRIIKGHGLGLSIVKRIINKLGGEVGLDHEWDHGCKFWFTLPQEEIETPAPLFS